MYPKFCEGKVPLKQMVRSLSPMEENQRFCLSPVQGDSLGSTLYFGSFFKIAIKVVRTPRLSWVHTPCLAITVVIHCYQCFMKGQNQDGFQIAKLLIPPRPPPPLKLLMLPKPPIPPRPPPPKPPRPP